jgi:lipoprotein-anchoring transpeptidase ErfK/SrfK
VAEGQRKLVVAAPTGLPAQELAPDLKPHPSKHVPLFGESAAPETKPPVQMASLEPPRPKDGAAPAVESGKSPAPPSSANEVQLATPGGELMASLGRKPVTDGELALTETEDETFQDPTSWSIAVAKSAHRVALYYKGHLFRTYQAVFGRNPETGTKRWEGDLRTPEGVYTIIDKYYSPRWKRFLLLNYPNLIDRRRYLDMVDSGVVPVINGQRREVGGAIGIHGTDRPRYNQANMNWTNGCVSVDNDAILELEKILPVGTVVVIKP